MILGSGYLHVVLLAVSRGCFLRRSSWDCIGNLNPGIGIPCSIPYKPLGLQAGNFRTLKFLYPIDTRGRIVVYTNPREPTYLDRPSTLYIPGLETVHPYLRVAGGSC